VSEIRPLARARVADQIIEELRGQIASGALPRGSRLPTERELARQFAVSPPTVRESIRALNTMGLVEVRHGSGAYVTAEAAPLLASSLGTVLQLEGVSVQEVLRLLGHLNAYTAQLATERATDDDVAAVRAALEAIEAAQSAPATAAAVVEFARAMLAAAHDRLLAILADFLVRLVVELEVRACGAQSASFWEQWASRLQPARARIVEALAQRDRERLTSAVAEFHRQATALIESDPALRDARFSDPYVAAIMASVVHSTAPLARR
jgi:GntR family transcriptional repressor for pyruvate dehydrogenase complex